MRAAEECTAHFADHEGKVRRAEVTGDTTESFPREIPGFLRLASQDLAEHREETSDLGVALLERKVLRDLHDTGRDRYTETIFRLVSLLKIQNEAGEKTS